MTTGGRERVTGQGMAKKNARKGKAPAFQFYPADYLADENVALMTLEEQGAYLRLMCFEWREGSIPADIKKLARLCGCSADAMQQMWGALAPCFEPHPEHDDRLVHPRLQKERDALRSRSEQARKAAQARWSKQDAGDDAPKNSDSAGNAGGMRSHSGSIADAKRTESPASASATAMKDAVSSFPDGHSETGGERRPENVDNEPDDPDPSEQRFRGPMAKAVKEHAWQADHPPRRLLRMLDKAEWDAGNELSIAQQWVREGTCTADEAVLVPKYARTVLGVEGGTPFSLRLLHDAERRGKLSEVLGVIRKRGPPANGKGPKRVNIRVEDGDAA